MAEDTKARMTSEKPPTVKMGACSLCPSIVSAQGESFGSVASAMPMVRSAPAMAAGHHIVANARPQPITTPAATIMATIRTQVPLESEIRAMSPSRPASSRATDSERPMAERAGVKARKGQAGSRPKTCTPAHANTGDRSLSTRITTLAIDHRPSFRVHAVANSTAPNGRGDRHPGVHQDRGEAPAV
jgi:hypothetical protein